MTKSEERFWSKFERQGDCLVWTRFRFSGKYTYGMGGVNGESGLTHRLAWELRHGPIPKGMNVLHRCDNYPCAADEHLFLGTQSDNMRDASAKGRVARGERQGRAKLTEEIVRAARERYRLGHTLRGMAREYGVAHEVLRRAVHGHTWSYLSRSVG